MMNQDQKLSGVLDRYVVKQAPDGIIVADPEGIIRLWNAGAERIFGYVAEEAVGARLDLIVPERFREAHWAGYHRALGEGKTQYAGQAMPTRAMHKDGSSLYVELTFAVLQDGAGMVLGALAQVRDITERYAQDRTLRRRVTELEQEVQTLREAGSHSSEIH